MAENESELEGTPKTQEGTDRSLNPGPVPVYTKKNQVLKGNWLSFVKTMKISATALVDSVAIQGETACRAVPAVYRQIEKIAVLNLAGATVIKKGTKIAELHPLRISGDNAETRGESIKEVKDGETTITGLFSDLQLREK